MNENAGYGLLRLNADRAKTALAEIKQLAGQRLQTPVDLQATMKKIHDEADLALVALGQSLG